MKTDVNYAADGEIITISPLKELSEDLIEECIKSQINDPFGSVVDFLTQFMDGYEEDIDDMDTDSDEYAEAQQTAREFFMKVLKLIDEKFDLQIDYDAIESDLGLSGILNLTEALYTFFILRYEKNVSKFIFRSVTDMEDVLGEDLASRYGDDKVTVEYSGLSRKIDDHNKRLIIMHLNEAVSAVRSFEITPDDFIKIFNQDRFDVAVLSVAINKFIITGEFIDKFLDPVFNDGLQDNNYDKVFATIHHKLYKRYKNDKEFKIEFVDDEEKTEEE